MLKLSCCASLRDVRCCALTRNASLATVDEGGEMVSLAEQRNAGGANLSPDQTWSLRVKLSLLLMAPHGATRRREQVSYRSVGQSCRRRSRGMGRSHQAFNCLLSPRRAGA